MKTTKIIYTAQVIRYHLIGSKYKGATKDFDHEPTQEEIEYFLKVADADSPFMANMQNAEVIVTKKYKRI